MPSTAAADLTKARFHNAPISIKLQAIEEGSKQAPDKVQIIRVGSFHDWRYDFFEVTQEVLASMLKNFQDNVLGVDIAIDYAHNAHLEAAAWITGLELRNDGTELWGNLTWTPDGKQCVEGGEYRYLSADFTFDYIQNETLQHFGPTLYGAGLTNRPVVDGMAPIINLSEGKGVEMDPKDKKIQELEAQLAKDAEARKSEQAELATLKAEVGTLKASAEQAQAEKIAAAKKSQFDVKLSKGVVVEAQREAFMKGDMDKFMELAQPVNPKAQGHGEQAETQGDVNSSDAEEKLLAIAKANLSEGKSPTMRLAIRKARFDNPELVKQIKQNQETV